MCSVIVFSQSAEAGEIGGGPPGQREDPLEVRAGAWGAAAGLADDLVDQGLAAGLGVERRRRVRRGDVGDDLVEEVHVTTRQLPVCPSVFSH
jgi:hypothetical protein